MNDDRDNAQKRTSVLLFLLCFSVPFGAADALLYRSEAARSASGMLWATMGAVAVLVWCIYDARIKKYPIPLWFKFAIFCLAGVTVPIYLQKTRGWRDAAKIGFGVPVFVGAIVTFYVGWYGAYWIARFAGYYAK